MSNRPIASDELEPPHDSDHGAINGPVPHNNSAQEEQYAYPDEHYGQTPNVPTTNVKGFLPYRGNEQHGVRFNHDKKQGVPVHSHYQAEQRAFDTYVDPHITPRDIVPPNTIKVEVLDTPSLIYRRVSRASSYMLTVDGVYHQILAADPMRKRAVISVRTSGTFYVGMLSPEDTPTDLQAIEFAGGSYQTLLDTKTTSGLWVKITNSDAAVRINYWAEYIRYDGEKIL